MQLLTILATNNLPLSTIPPKKIFLTLLGHGSLWFGFHTVLLQTICCESLLVFSAKIIQDRFLVCNNASRITPELKRVRLQTVFRIRDVYPGSRSWFYPSKIPDPKKQQKRGKQVCCLTIFLATNFTKLKIVLFLNRYRFFFSANWQRSIEGTVEEGNTEHLSAFNVILKILRNIFSEIFFHRRANE